MPEKMIGRPPDRSDPDDVLAAEFVLGLLNRDEHARAEHRLLWDVDFAERVAWWQDQASGLDAEFGDETPPSRVKALLDDRLFGMDDARQPPTLWGSLAFWRGLAVAAFCALAFVVVDPAGLREPEPDLVVAALSGAEELAFVAVYDPESAVLRVAQTVGAGPESLVRQLWLLADDDPPRSLGLLGQIAVLDPDLGGRLRPGVTLAISLEPPGGSPTGAPTGPVIATGRADAL